MLRWFDSNGNLSTADIPHRTEYQSWMANLTDEDRAKIFEYLDGLIESGSIHTSSWLPGSDWRETPLQIIFEKATRYSEQQAGWCFGLMLMERIIKRPEQWYCKKDIEVAEGTIYWRA